VRVAWLWGLGSTSQIGHPRSESPTVSEHPAKGTRTTHENHPSEGTDHHV
jgi:hypothetical protein